MVNDDILGGLKSALSRGYSLKDAMFSFYNAGYKKEEIEDAARAVQAEIAKAREQTLAAASPVKADAPASLAGTLAAPKTPATLPLNPGPAAKVPNPAKSGEPKDAVTGTGPEKTNPPAQKTESELKGKTDIPSKAELKKELKGQEAAEKKENKEKEKKEKAKPMPKAKGMVSNYPGNRKTKAVTLILIFLLLLLFGALGAIIVFKQEIIQLLNKIF